MAEETAAQKKDREVREKAERDRIAAEQADKDRQATAEAEKSKTAGAATGGPQEVVVTGRPIAGTGTAAAVETLLYKLRPGKTHIHDGRMLKSGETIELNRNQARAFVDKFEPINKDQKFKEDQPTGEAVSSENAPQGAPPQSLVVPIPESKVNLEKPPEDPNSLDPARQGQRARAPREQWS